MRNNLKILGLLLCSAACNAAEIVVDDVNNIKIDGANVGCYLDAYSNYPVLKDDVQTAVTEYLSSKADSDALEAERQVQYVAMQIFITEEVSADVPDIVKNKIQTNADAERATTVLGVIPEAVGIAVNGASLRSIVPKTAFNR